MLQCYQLGSRGHARGIELTDHDSIGPEQSPQTFQQRHGPAPNPDVSVHEQRGPPTTGAGHGGEHRAEQDGCAAAPSMANRRRSDIDTEGEDPAPG